MDKNVLYPILSILIVVLAAGAVYYVADMFGGTEIHHEGEEGHGGEEGEGHGEGHEGSAEEAEQLFFEAIRKPLDYDSYIFAYEEKASNGYMDSVYITASPNYSYVRKEDAIFTRELFLAENTTTLCLKTVNKELCSDVAQNSTFNPYVYTMSYLLYDHERIEKTGENNEFLVKYGAIVFDPEVHDKSYGETECKEIMYTLDYSKLTVEQMRIIGMDPKSPEVLLSKEYNFTLCIEPETKEVVHKSLTYMNFGDPAFTESTTTQSTWGEAADVQFPEEMGNESSMQEFYFALKKSQENYAKCLIDEHFENCMRSEAILSRNERLCELIPDTDARDGCYLNVALEKGTPDLCTYLSEELQPDCYIEFAWKYKDTSYCSPIQDSAKQQECIFVITEPGEEPAIEEELEQEAEEEPEEETEPEPGEAECTVDSDCATAGCSSHLCVPLSLSDVVTTCEYLEEYDCLPLTTCGCVNGQCTWNENQEYLNCLDEKTS